jgi:hypothetical protein
MVIIKIKVYQGPSFLTQAGWEPEFLVGGMESDYNRWVSQEKSEEPKNPAQRFSSKILLEHKEVTCLDMDLTGVKITVFYVC